MRVRETEGITMKCTVMIYWDDEAQGWYCESDDIPGLALRSNSFDALIVKIRIAAPEMLKLNCGYTGDIRLVYKTSRTVSLAAAAAE
jgi:hypothetical protein